MRWREATIKHAAILAVQASVDGGGDWDLCFVYDVDIHEIVLVSKSSSEEPYSHNEKQIRIYG